MTKPTILLIEHNTDQWLLIQALVHCLFPEVEPIWLANQKDVILHLETCSLQTGKLPKLILLDLQLPHLNDGFGMLQSLKSHYLYRQIPIIALGQSSNVNDILISYRLGSNSYIVKPTNYEKWCECIVSLRQFWWITATLPPIT